MTYAEGLLYDGVNVGLPFVRRDSRAWWTEGRETRPRADVIDLGFAHWTGGPPRYGDNAALTLFRSMNARKGKSGEDLSVSVQFTIATDGTVWQLADMRTACVHVGDRTSLARSYGVEFAWPGTAKQARALKIPHTAEDLQWGDDARPVRVAQLPAPMLVAYRRLTLGILGLSLPGLAVPRVLAPMRPFESKAEANGFKGLAEHANLPGTTKRDLVGQSLRYLGKMGL